MSTANVALILVAVGAFALAGLYGVHAAADNSRHDITIENESFTPDAGELETFNRSSLERAEYEQNVTVRFDNGSVAAQPGNYTWHQGNGTLTTLARSELANVNNATVTYNYTGHTLGQAGVTQAAIDAQTVLRVLALVAGGALALAGVLLFAGVAAA